eukprot:1349676-Rhodomonas_salina.4
MLQFMVAMLTSAAGAGARAAAARSHGASVACDLPHEDADRPHRTRRLLEIVMGRRRSRRPSVECSCCRRGVQNGKNVFINSHAPYWLLALDSQRGRV